MATNFSMADCKIIHLTTLIDANDALNKSYVDTQTNNLLKTDWTKPICPDLNNMCNWKKIYLPTLTNGKWSCK